VGGGGFGGGRSWGGWCADFPKSNTHLNILDVSSATFSQFHPGDQHTSSAASPYGAGICAPWHG